MRNGGDYFHPKGEHRAQAVLTEMYVQILRDYSSLPDPRSLKAHEIRFFYEALRFELKESTKPRN